MGAFGRILERRYQQQPAEDDRQHRRPRQLVAKLAQRDAGKLAGEQHARINRVDELPHMAEPVIDRRLPLRAEAIRSGRVLHQRRGKYRPAQRRQKAEERRHQGEEDAFAAKNLPRRRHQAVDDPPGAELKLQAHHEIQSQDDLPRLRGFGRIPHRRQQLGRGRPRGKKKNRRPRQHRQAHIHLAVEENDDNG